MNYRDYKGRRTDKIKKDDICLFGDIVEGGEDLNTILENENYYSYDREMLVYFKIIEKNNNLLDTKIKITELITMSDVA